MAAYAATVAKPDGLVVEAGFPDVRSLVRGSPPLFFLALFSSYRFPTASFIGRARVPVLVMHGDDGQIVPYADSAPLSAELLQNGTLKTYAGFPHGMPTTQADTINADLPAFVQCSQLRTRSTIEALRAAVVPAQGP